MKFVGIILLWTLIPLSGVEGKVSEDGEEKPKGELIFLRDFGTDEVGYLAIPDQAPEAGIVVAHGKFGLNKDIRLLCDRLSAGGYLVLAVDLYNGNIPSSFDDINKNISTYSSPATISAIKTGINFFQLSPRFKMEKVVLLGIGESTRDVLATARSNENLSGVTLLEPQVLPNTEVMNEIGVPVMSFVSLERDISIDVEAINRGVKQKLLMRRLPEVVFDDEQAFKRIINERVWQEADVFWRQIKVPERSITDRIIKSVF